MAVRQRSATETLLFLWVLSIQRPESISVAVDVGASEALASYFENYGVSEGGPWQGTITVRLEDPPAAIVVPTE